MSDRFNSSFDESLFDSNSDLFDTKNLSPLSKDIQLALDEVNQSSRIINTSKRFKSRMNKHKFNNSYMGSITLPNKDRNEVITPNKCNLSAKELLCKHIETDSKLISFYSKETCDQCHKLIGIFKSGSIQEKDLKDIKKNLITTSQINKLKLLIDEMNLAHKSNTDILRDSYIGIQKLDTIINDLKQAETFLDKSLTHLDIV